MSEKITIDIQVTVDVTNLEGLRRLGSFVVSPAGEEPYAYVPQGDAQSIAAIYFGKLVTDAANAHPEVFREPAVKSS